MVKLLEDSGTGMFDCVVVHMLDRWARNVGVQRQALKQLGESKVGFASVTEDVDFTTPSGRLLLTTMGGVAEFFSDQLGLHVQKAQKQLAESGLVVGPVPFGYKRQEKRLPPLKVVGEAAGVKEGFLRRAEGQSMGEIAAWLNTQGYLTRECHAFTSHAVKDMLNNHFYCGYFKYQNKEFSGKHEAIISEDLYQKVQNRRQRIQNLRSVHGPKGLLQGMIACSNCGNGLQSDRHRQQVPLYRERHAHECLTNNTSIVADPIDRQVATIVHSLEIQPDWKKKMADLAMSNYNGPSPTTLQEKRRRLSRAYSDGAYSDEEYNRRLAEIDCQLQQANTVTAPAMEEAVELFSNIPMLWNEATQEERRMLVKSLVELVYVDLKTKHVTAVKPTPAFRAMFGTGIDVGPDVPIELQSLYKKSEDIGGDGGDGGESNSP